MDSVVGQGQRRDGAAVGARGGEEDEAAAGTGGAFAQGLGDLLLEGAVVEGFDVAGLDVAEEGEVARRIAPDVMRLDIALGRGLDGVDGVRSRTMDRPGASRIRPWQWMRA